MTTVSVPSDDVPDRLERAGGLPDGVSVIVWDGSGDRPDGADDIEFFVGAGNSAPPDASVLAGLPALKVVQLTSAGVEPWLPVIPDGVLLCNGRGVHGPATAELAVAGMLAQLRELVAFDHDRVEHHWDQHQTDGLTDANLLVLGAGDIGARIAAAAQQFGARTTMVARTARDGVRTMDELPQLLPDQQVVAVALPSTPQTQGVVDAKFLAAMPDGALLVNIARGSIVDTDALLAELTAGRLRAFLDVTDPEPLPADHPLWDAPNLLLTPHVGGVTRGWEQRAYQLVHDQIERYVSGEPLQNRIEHGY